MLDSKKHNHVFWTPAGSCQAAGDPLGAGWYFWDEVGLLGGGPYKTEDLAAEGLNRHAATLSARETAEDGETPLSCSATASHTLCRICLANEQFCSQGQPKQCGNRIDELLTEISELKNGIKRVSELVNRWAIEIDIPQSDKLCSPESLHELVGTIFTKTTESAEQIFDTDEVVAAVVGGEQVLDSSGIDSMSELVEALVCGPVAVWLPEPEGVSAKPSPTTLGHKTRLTGKLWSVRDSKYALPVTAPGTIITLPDTGGLAVSLGMDWAAPGTMSYGVAGTFRVNINQPVMTYRRHNVYMTDECNMNALVGWMGPDLSEQEVEYLCDEGFIVKPIDGPPVPVQSCDMGGDIREWL